MGEHTTAPVCTPSGQWEQDPVPETIGRYAVQGRLGAGGMGVVFEAHDDELDRRVAIKVLESRHGGGSLGEARARLRREGHALARLSHPNVVQVYDVGLYGSQLFVAMELVEGQTLRAWLRDRDHERQWQQGLDLLVQAGRGLAAAHESGLVHRDFKPGNVIVGSDGRVRVLDFGLARLTGESTRSGDDGFRSGSVSVSGPISHSSRANRAGHSSLMDHGSRAMDSGSGSRLTETGTVMGTYAYMAPEQWEGGEVGPAADQYAFCVTLFEALYEDRPFRRKYPRRVHQSRLTGELSVPRPNSGVPAWLHRVVIRGLAFNPDDRWESMPALLAALSNDPRGRWTWGAGIAVIAAGTGWLYVAGQEASPRCDDAPQRLHGVWSPSTRDAGRQAFAATGLAYADGSWSRVDGQLDGYARAWIDAYGDVCREAAKGAVGAESDLRMMCLRDRQGQFSTVVEILTNADPALVRRSVAVVSKLPSIAACLRGDNSEMVMPGPENPVQAARIVELRGRLSAVEGRMHAGHWRAAGQEAKALLPEVEATSHEPLVAETLLALGQLELHLGKLQAAENHLEGAYWTAEKLGHDAVALEAASELMVAVGVVQARTEEGMKWARHARSRLDRRGSGGLPQRRFREGLASLHYAQGNYEEAAQEFRRALSLDVEGQERTTPITARTLGNLANVLFQQGKYEEAFDHYRRGRDGLEASFGPEHPDLGISSINLGNTLLMLGRREEAITHWRQAVATLQQATGPDDPNLVPPLSGLGQAYTDLGRYAEAERELDRALQIVEKTRGSDHPDMALPLDSLGAMHHLRGNYDRALEYYRRALVIEVAALGDEHPALATSYTNIGMVLFDLSRPRDAIEPLEKALHLQQGSSNAFETARLRHKLAQALHRVGKDPKRTRSLLESAQAELRTVLDDPGMLAEERITKVREVLADVDALAATLAPTLE